MTNVTIPALPAGSSPSASSPIESVEGGVSVRYTLAQIGAPLAGAALPSPLGIGRAPETTPPNGPFILDIADAVPPNGKTAVRVTNANPGNAAYATLVVHNGTHGGALAHFGLGYTAPGDMRRADGTYIWSDGAGGLTLDTQAAASLYLGTNFIERMQIDANGRVMVHGLPNAANDAAAAGLGVPVDGLYRNGSVVMVRVV